MYSERDTMMVSEVKQFTTIRLEKRFESSKSILKQLQNTWRIRVVTVTFAGPVSVDFLPELQLNALKKVTRR